MSGYPSLRGIDGLDLVLADRTAREHAERTATPVARFTAKREGVNTLASARQLIALMDRGAALLPGLFAVPGMYIVLDLFIASRSGNRISISSACIASRAPQATALRRIQQLCDQGVTRRLPDPYDARRHFLELTPEADMRIEKWLEAGAPGMA